ncbi:uncharacterized protein LOC142803108 [Rhipicephalus microplus]|uniref:uncharacterized protein LOC142803108 n=1 Tax=Rhipicephalus microplus TaxID=6941 RepID=UPI003F6A8BF1
MAYCKVCDCKLRPHLQDLQLHTTRNKHVENIKRMKLAAVTKPIDSHFKPGPSKPTGMELKVAELRLAAHVAVHSSLSTADHLAPLLANALHNSTLSEEEKNQMLVRCRGYLVSCMKSLLKRLPSNLELFENFKFLRPCYVCDASFSTFHKVISMVTAPCSTSILESAPAGIFNLFKHAERLLVDYADWNTVYWDTIDGVLDTQEPEAHVQQQEHEDPNVLPEVETSDAVHADAEVHRVCGNLRLPDETWNKLTFCSERDSALYGVCELEGEQVDHILLPKFVKFKANSSQQNSLCCFVYLRGKLHSQCTVSSPEEAQSVLDSTHALALCQGCGMRPEKQGQYVLFAGNYFSAKCTYVCESGSCIHCKYLRKLVQNQMSRKRRSGGMYKRQKKLANTRRSLRTAQKKVLNAERELAAMRQANQQIADEVLGARIKSLPEKQQMAVRACFEAATRKSTSGMLYEKEWILECVLLRMCSPKLYEQLRKQKVLILPSRTCLQRYTRSFKSGFGFNKAVFNALAIKTKDMDISSRHGGIIFDEMKLAEHFNVSAAGKRYHFFNRASDH